MVGANSIIPTRSRQQAEEWSLVLLSQQLESVVEQTNENGLWQLSVPSDQCGRALRILRQYKIENRVRPLLPLTGQKLMFDWGNLWFFAVLIAVFIGNETAGGNLTAWGRMDSTAFLSGQWWRPATAILLHHDLPHLIANAVIGMLFLGVAGGLFGTGRAFLISFSSGLLANLAACWFHPGGYLAVGASGAVMGTLGLITSHSLFDRSGDGTAPQRTLRGVAGGLLLLILLGFDPQPRTDVLAHVFGFSIGLLLGALTEAFRHRKILLQPPASTRA
jgi:membrane associated rhomboid family serine protease